MGKAIDLLVDTDIFIDYFNHHIFRDFFESGKFVVYYSVVTKKELLAKEGLKDSEVKSIRSALKNCRLIPLDPKILSRYSDLLKEFTQIAKEDTLIAATALMRNLPLATRNYRHFRFFPGLKLYFSA